jgi:hypothetical protein
MAADRHVEDGMPVSWHSRLSVRFRDADVLDHRRQDRLRGPVGLAGIETGENPP